MSQPRSGEDEATTTQSAAKADPAPNEAFHDEMDRLRTRLRKIGGRAGLADAPPRSSPTGTSTAVAA
jgi:hypothetical protein